MRLIQSIILLLFYFLYVTTVPIVYTFGNAAPFNGSNLTSVDCGPGCFKLIDNITGPTDSIYDDLGSFFAFNRQSGIGNVVFLLPVDVDVSRVMLYFFNSPKDSIGLPQITISKSGGANISFTYDDNDELDQSDSRLRTVSLNLMESSSNVITISIMFINSIQIDLFLLSEVEFYNGKLVSLHFINSYFNIISRSSHTTFTKSPSVPG